MKVVIMAIKKVWFDRILSGEKTCEYREYKPYWIIRLTPIPNSIIFRNGYSKKSPSFICDVEQISVINGKHTDLMIDKDVFKIDLINIRACE